MSDDSRPNDWQTQVGRGDQTQGSEGLSGQRRGIAPRQIGPYRVIRPLAQGSMGAVFEVEHVENSIRYALKAPHSAEWAEDLERFRREALSLAKLDHPNVVRIHDAQLEGDRPYLVEDLLPKGSLEHKLRERGALPAEEAVAIATKIARGLSAAHDLGMLHRDIKPSNILFDDRDEPRLADFGLVSEQQQVHRLTLTGQLLGTPAYMAPEQALGKNKEVDARTDVYAVGVLLYTMLRGRPPFAGQLYEVLDRVATRPAPSLLDGRPELAQGVVNVCQKSMSKAREDRYPTADALVVALETCLSLDAPRRRALPLRSIAVAAGLLALVGIVAVSRGASTSGAPPSAVDTTPPTLRLSVPRDGLEVWAETVSVEGRVSPDDPKTVHVTVKGHPEVSVSWSGRTFRAMVSLRADERGVDVVVTDAAGNTASASRTLRRPPRWLLEVAPGQRPPIPLPLGMSFGAAPGEYVNDRDGSVLVWIAPAAFPMGSKRARRMVRLTRGYFLGKYEVSWAQFRRYCAARKARVPNNRSAMPTGEVEAGENHPVFRVTWDEAVAYCNWAGLRLPTEAEWELGAAGTEGRRYPWGSSEPNGSRLNLADASTRGIFVGTEPWSDGHPVTAPVDAYPDGVSPYGCFNMVGNVSEWVADRWSEHPSLTELTDPLGPDSGHAHVVKSGSFKVGRAWCYSAFRATWTTSETIGFRVCRWP